MGFQVILTWSSATYKVSLASSPLNHPLDRLSSSLMLQRERRGSASHRGRSLNTKLSLDTIMRALVYASYDLPQRFLDKEVHVILTQIDFRDANVSLNLTRPAFCTPIDPNWIVRDVTWKSKGVPFFVTSTQTCPGNRIIYYFYSTCFCIPLFSRITSR